MSNLPQQVTINQYSADGITTIFAYNFLILLNTDINVYITPPGQPAVPSAQKKVLGVDYTVTGVNNLTGGTVVFTTAPDNAATVTFEREIGASINTNFSAAQNISGPNLDSSFQRVVLVEQQNKTNFEQRGIQYAVNSLLPVMNSDQTLPVLGEGQIWQKMNGAVAAVTLEENPDVSTLRSELAQTSPNASGTSIIGYYDTISKKSILLQRYLDTSFLTVIDTGPLNSLQATILNTSFSEFINGMRINIIVGNTTTVPGVELTINGIGGGITIYRDLNTFSQPGDLIAGQIAELLLLKDNISTKIIHLNYDKTPSGVSRDFCGGSLPPGNLLEDGSAVSRIVYPALYAAIGINWGPGDGSTTFNLPDFRRRTAVGSGGVGSGELGNTVGSVGGEETHILTIPQMPSHNHTPSSGVGDSFIVRKSGLNGSTTGSDCDAQSVTGSTGGGQAHNIIQPSGVVAKIIKI